MEPPAKEPGLCLWQTARVLPGALLTGGLPTSRSLSTVCACTKVSPGFSERKARLRVQQAKGLESPPGVSARRARESASYTSPLVNCMQRVANCKMPCLPQFRAPNTGEGLERLCRIWAPRATRRAPGRPQELGCSEAPPFLGFVLTDECVSAAALLVFRGTSTPVLVNKFQRSLCHCAPAGRGIEGTQTPTVPSKAAGTAHVTCSPSYPSASNGDLEICKHTAHPCHLCHP